MSDWTDIKHALKAGDVVLLPTETVYGLAAEADNESAISKIYAIKGREFSKPLAVCVRDMAQGKTLAHFDETSEHLAQRYWPGSLTLVLDTSAKLDSRVTSESNGTRTIALRCPDVHWREAMDKPLALTSANRSGQPDCVTYEDAMRELEDEIAASLPAKAPLSGSPSTIIRVSDGQLTLLRQGELQVTS